VAISFPRTDIFTGRGFAQVKFDLAPRQEASRTAGGVTIGKDLGSELFLAEWQTVPEALTDQVTFDAMMRSLRGLVGTFDAYDRRRPYPKAYPSGSFSDSGKIAAVASTGTLSLKELPAGFVISVGDYFMFDYGSSPTNRALHQAMEAVTADGSGNTATFEVAPYIRAGAAADIAVKFKLPSARFRLDPGGISSVVQNVVHGVTTFRATQAID
jgi:hypothetical protein